MELTRRPTAGNEYLAAMATVRAAKNWLMSIILLAMAAQVAGFVLVRWVGAIDRSTPVKEAVDARNDLARIEREKLAPPPQRQAASVPASQPASQPVSTQPASAPEILPAGAPVRTPTTMPAEVETPAPAPPAAIAPATAPATATAPAEMKREPPGSASTQPGRFEGPRRKVDDILSAVLLWAMPATNLTALIAGILLALTLLMATNLALLGRTGGVSNFISAFFWSLLAWVVLLLSMLITGCFYYLGDLIQATAQVTWAVHDTGRTVALLDEILYYLRFLGLPALALAVLLVVQSKFARGYHRTRASVTEGNFRIGEDPDKI